MQQCSNERNDVTFPHKLVILACVSFIDDERIGQIKMYERTFFKPCANFFSFLHCYKYQRIGRIAENTHVLYAFST